MAHLPQLVDVRSQLAQGLLVYLKSFEEGLDRAQQRAWVSSPPPELARVAAVTRQSRRALESRAINADGLRPVPVLVDLAEIARAESMLAGGLRLSEYLGRTTPAAVLGWIASLLLSERCQLVIVRGQGLLHGNQRASLERLASELADQGCHASVVPVDADFDAEALPTTGIATMRRAIAGWFGQFEVPDAPVLFLGRDRDLQLLHDGFAARRRQVVTGDRGVGKTTLALAYAHRYRHRYDAVFWVDWSTKDRDFERLLRRYRIPPRAAGHTRTGARLSTPPRGSEGEEFDVDVAALAIQQWLDDVATASLLVVDNVDDWNDVERRIDPSYRSHLILIARRPPLTTAEKMSELRLGGWDADTGCALLIRAGGVVSPGHDEETAARRIHDEAGGLPAAIVRVVDYIAPRSFSCRTFMELPKADRDAVYRHYDSLHDWVGALAAIRDAAAREPKHVAAPDLLSVLACIDLAHLDLALLTDAVGKIRKGRGSLPYSSEILTKEALFLLQAHSLIEVARDGSGARMLPAVREGVFQTLPEDEQRAAAKVAAAALGDRKARITTPAFFALDAPDPARWAESRIALLDGETGVLSTSWGNLEQRVPYADRLCDFANELLAVFRRYSDPPADTAAAAANGSASRLVATFLTRTAFLLTNLKRQAEAQPLFEAAQAIFESGDDTAGLAETLARQGDNLDLIGRRSEARALFQRALDLRTPLFGARDLDAGHICNALGLSFLDSGEFAAAEPQFKQALDIGTACSDRSLAGAAYYNLGTLYERQANPAACEFYAQAVDSLEDTGIRWMVAQARRDLDRCRQGLRRQN